MSTEYDPADRALEEKKLPVSSQGSDHDDEHLLGKKSIGVKRIEAIAAQFTFANKVFLLAGILLISYVYTLNNVIGYTYQPVATASLDEHSLSATVSVARSVIAAAGQPVIAKIADVFGRVELVYLSIVLYTVGVIIQAAAQNLTAVAAGAILFQLGFTVVQLLVEVLIADLTSLQSRLVFSFIPASPYLINTWVSGNIAQAVLDGPGWRWGYGMFAIIFPICILPLLAALHWAGRRARRNEHVASLLTPLQALGFRRFAAELFWQLDIIGMVLIIAIFGLILVPLTLAGGTTSQWDNANIIVPLVIGFCCIPPFVIWEMRCRHPLVPFHLLRDRGVWGALGIALFLNFSWYMQGDYLYTVLSVAFDQSTLSATRISGLFTFCSVLTGFGVGLVVRFVKHLKWFIVFGSCLWMVAFGLLIRYRGGSDGSAISGIIGAEIMLGIAGGFFTYPAQASIQSCTKHEHVAVITGLYLAVYYVGSALGNTVSGAYWTNSLPTRLAENLAGFPNADVLVASAYANPFGFIVTYPMGTPERIAVVNAYMATQKVLCIIGICLGVPLIAFALCTRNHRLGKEQSIQGAERYAPGADSDEDVVKGI